MDTPAATGDADGNSDYGSDFTPDEESLLTGLLHQQGPPLDHEDDNPNDDIKSQLQDLNNDTAGQRGIKIPLSAFAKRDPRGQESGEQTLRKELGDNSLRSLSANIESPESRTVRERSESIEAPLDPKPDGTATDLRSPLERFRTQRKGLSVTDLISPSWCELQYWYVLTKHGRKRRTPEMKRGSSIHQTLEDQVHTTVTVKSVATKEDSWGLRLWNMIQGLRTLRETRMTRELEVWGVIDGLVVRGVIDEISYACPDPELEVSGAKRKAGKKMELGADQTTITDFLGATGTLENNGAGLLESLGAAAVRKTDRVYLTDVKTRSTKASLPKGASFRPTLLQLMLYHRMLSDMVTGKVDIDAIFGRYRVDADAPFTDGFIAEVGHLNEGLYNASQASSEQSQDPPMSSQDSWAVLLANNSLRALWKLLIREFSLTLPRGANSIGTVLKAEYRDRTEGDVVGVKTFLYDEQTLDKYLEDELRWWRGERAPQGVCIEEAYKCGYCEFAEECSWRKNKIEDAAQKMRERQRSRV